MINTLDIKSKTNCNWHYILTALGVDSTVLTNKHQSCPFCGGKDRYRFDDKHKGMFICNQCGSGDGFEFVMRYFNYDFKGALNAITEVLGDCATYPLPRQKTNTNTPKLNDKRDNITSLWNRGKEIQADDEACIYLSNRGLNIDALLPINNTALRFIPNLTYWTQGHNNAFIPLGDYPVMVGAIRALDGELMGVHCTYLNNGTKLSLINQHTGEYMPAKKIRNRYAGSLKGASIQLYQPNDILCVAEGIENALASYQLNQLPVWACLSAYGMTNLNLPNNINELIIIADNDINQVGNNAANTLARKAHHQGIKVRIWQHEKIGHDALDLLEMSHD